jgi:hypothetical protein
MSRPSTVRKKKARKSRKGWRTAKGSDRHELYEASVQEPEAEVDLVDQVWKERRRRLAHSIREDFCGTAAMAMEWVKRRRANTAIAVDLDDEVLDWGRAKLPDRLTPAQRTRLTILQADVRTIRTEPVDSILAMNFSYFIFKQREELKSYFQRCHAGLVRDGLLLLDAYGGSESFEEMEEERDLDGFTYVWDQAVYNPITGQVINHIHYRFPDGSEIKKAFTYDWRLWTIPELRDILLDAGFKDVVVYWEGTNKRTNEGNGVWKISDRGEACEGWIAYLVAEK